MTTKTSCYARSLLLVLPSSSLYVLIVVCFFGEGLLHSFIVISRLQISQTVDSSVISTNKLVKLEDLLTVNIEESCWQCYTLKQGRYASLRLLSFAFLDGYTCRVRCGGCCASYFALFISFSTSSVGKGITIVWF